jgi:hypothetical protein
MPWRASEYERLSAVRECKKHMSLLTWKTPHETPHIASPHAKMDKDGAKTGMKIMTAIHVIKIIMVGRQPSLS